MNWQPVLGFFDGARDLADPQLYDATLAGGRTLPAFTYRSKAFADLEDEKVWTRAWSCIGYADRIPNPGDLYPFTVGQHGIHVQRQPDGSLKAHFNFAQHGGCRFVPRQCQTGKKTSCFYTSCGHSRDRDVIAANPDGSDTPEMYMYVGVNPLKLIPIHLATVGSLMFVNLDFDCAPVQAQLHETVAGAALAERMGAAGGHRHRAECELPCNWKLAGRLILETLDRGDVDFGDTDGADVYNGNVHTGGLDAIDWLYPNLVVARRGDFVSTCLLQPQAMNATRVITDVFSASDIRADTPVDAIAQAVARLAEAARRLQTAIAGADDPSPFLPQAGFDVSTQAERTTTVQAFNARLVAQILTRHHYVDRPLFTHPGRSLNAGVNSGAF